MPDKAIDLVDEACAICSLKSTSYSEKSAELIEKIRQIDEQKEEALLSLDLEGAAVLKDMELGYRQRLDALIKQEKENRTKPTLLSDDIYDLITQIVGTDINVLGNERFSGLKERLSRAVIGQEEAVEALCDGVMSASIKMGRKERPLGVFLFVGESGVGKTALAEALAKEVLGSEKFLLRFDMSEFSERSSTAGFIGSAPGYVGYDDGAGVLNRVRRQPYSVVLFDEIEKASPEVRNLLLQITDYGKIRDSHGREVSFKNTYVIMTSNLGGAPSVGIGFEGNKGGTSSAERALRSVFSEELLGRMDRVVYFKHPEIADLISIARKRFDEIGLRLSEYNASLEYGDEVLSFVARKGLSLGSVRNILSVIKRDVESKIALLLSEKRDFGGVIRVGVSENRITVEETKPYAIP
jgi:ATP-dependent Clp protease ATP-binding subunit ClpC